MKALEMLLTFDVMGLFNYTINWLYWLSSLLGLDKVVLPALPPLKEVIPFIGYFTGFLPFDIVSQPFNEVVAANQRWFGYFLVNILVYCVATPAILFIQGMALYHLFKSK